MAENVNGLSEPLIVDKGVIVKNPFSKFFLYDFFCKNFQFHLNS